MEIITVLQYPLKILSIFWLKRVLGYKFSLFLIVLWVIGFYKTAIENKYQEHRQKNSPDTPYYVCLMIALSMNGVYSGITDLVCALTSELVRFVSTFSLTKPLYNWVHGKLEGYNEQYLVYKQQGIKHMTSIATQYLTQFVFGSRNGSGKSAFASAPIPGANQLFTSFMNKMPKKKQQPNEQMDMMKNMFVERPPVNSNNHVKPTIKTINESDALSSDSATNFALKKGRLRRRNMH